MKEFFHKVFYNRARGHLDDDWYAIVMHEMGAFAIRLQEQAEERFAP